MFIVLLRFSANKVRAPMFMDGHNAWIAKGFKDDIFLLTGSLHSGAGGVVIAHNMPRAELDARVKEDPFVAENVVTAEIIEIEPGRSDARLAFLVN